MKILIALTLTLMTVVSQATSLHPDTFAKQATLTKINIDQDGPLAGYGISHGSIKVNAVSKVAKLTLLFPVKCDRGFLCIEIMRVKEIELKITEIKRDCGSVIYVAKRDMRPADGALEVITVQDNTRRLCEDLRPAITEVTYTSTIFDWYQRGMFTSRNYFLADQLSSPF